jgi:hypothetical protein
MTQRKKPNSELSLEERVNELEEDVKDHDFQLGRLTSHIESEVGLSRKDIARIEKKLFGEEDDFYGGRIGQLAKAQHQISLKIAYASGGIALLIFLLQLFRTIFTSN